MKDDADLGGFELLKVDGGASNNGLLLQIQADTLQVGPPTPQQAGASENQLLCVLETSHSRNRDFREAVIDWNAQSARIPCVSWREPLSRDLSLLCCAVRS